MSPIQSPRLETHCASQSRKKASTRRPATARRRIGGSEASDGMNGASRWAGCSSVIRA